MFGCASRLEEQRLKVLVLLTDIGLQDQ